MKHTITSTVAVLMTVILLGSIAGTALLQQQASAFGFVERKEFKKTDK